MGAICKVSPHWVIGALMMAIAHPINLVLSALSPTPPFPKEKPRLVLTSVVAGALAVSLFTTSAMVIKGTTFGIGLGFFSDPLIWRGLDWLNKNYPNWQKLLELRK